MALFEFTESNFKNEVLESNLPVLVDFWAPWCGPCKMLAPHLEEVAKEFEGKIKVGKVNIDDHSGLAGRFGVMSIPTLMFFKSGKAQGQVVGVLSKQDLKKKIQEHI